MRASSSRSAAARRWRLSRSFAGVISASYVARGNPCSRAASTPMSTNWTPCFASVLKSRFGSSGAMAGVVSDTAGVRQEFAQVLDFFEPLFGSHSQDARHIVQHVRSHDDAGFELGAHREVHGLEQTLERLPGWGREAALDARDDRLRGAGAAREGALAETGPRTRLVQQGGGGRKRHGPNDS